MFKEFIKTDLDEQLEDQFEPSIKLTNVDKDPSEDTFSNLRNQDTTAGASIKMAV